MATAADVQHLREWISKQPHLPHDADDAFLERFLLGCKGRLSRCKEVLDMYYTVRATVPEFFRNRDPTSPEIRDIAKAAFLVTLPRLTPAGHHVTMQGLLDADPRRFSALAYMRRLFMRMDAFLATEVCAGTAVVVDLAGATFGHAAGFAPSLLRRFLVCAQDAWPSRIREFHIINGPPLADKILELAKHYVKEKTISKIHVHKSVETLYAFIPREILPFEYGGKCGHVKDLNDAAQQQLEQSKEWFAEEEKKLSYLPMRVNDCAVDLDSYFGLNGSFRTLAID
ncbi:alpha-tocopherol transfer protein-like [Bacillus rossius redtenbacheri]|uniref:alpha-tocopherol transfer protein-like n=1 Tax=Bacillus rossius redtenbacheri TaxID=93214 RepID=UPI002FDCAD6F